MDNGLAYLIVGLHDEVDNLLKFDPQIFKSVSQGAAFIVLRTVKKWWKQVSSQKIFIVFDDLLYT